MLSNLFKGFNGVRKGLLYNMTSMNTPAPFVISDISDGYDYEGNAVGPFQSPNSKYKCNANVSGRGIKLQIDLGRNYKNLAISAYIFGYFDKYRSISAHLLVYYTDTNTWEYIAQGSGGASIGGLYRTAKDRPVRYIKGESRYNSGDKSGSTSISQILVTEWQRA